MPGPQPTITNIEIWPIRQPGNGQTYVILRLSTDAGISGWGEVLVSDDAAAVVRRLDACRRELVGRDAVGVGQVSNLPGSRADVAAAVDTAQLDILGKLCNAPAYVVLGGPTRNKARALAPLAGHDEPSLLTSLAQAQQAGFRAVSVPLLLPDGPTRGRAFFDQTRKLLDRLRSASGGEVDFVLDCAGRTTHAEAAALASVLEDFHLLWLDEPMGQIQQKGFAGLGEESAVPIGWGRDATNNSQFQDLLRQDGVDVLRPDISRFGITAIRKAAALAETYYVAVAPRNTAGPIATAAALHVAASIPNFFIQEIPFPLDQRDRRLRRELAGDLETPTDGFLSLPTAPGLGITIAEEALRKYRLNM